MHVGCPIRTRMRKTHLPLKQRPDPPGHFRQIARKSPRFLRRGTLEEPEEHEQERLEQVSS